MKLVRLLLWIPPFTPLGVYLSLRHGSRKDARKLGRLIEAQGGPDA